MDKREKNISPVINVNIQVNMNSQNPVQDNSIKVVVNEQKKSTIHTWIGKMFKALVEFFSSVDSNSIIMLITMMIGMWL